MKRFLYGFAIVIALFTVSKSVAQDFSNKGKDFWVGYGLHCRMFQNNIGGTQDMVLYFATESVTNITVSIPGLGYSQTFSNIAANTIFTTTALPKTGTQDARLIQEGISSKGIHITSDKPVVAYAHIYNNNVSGATLLFPTNTLGKEYYSINFEQHSNEGNSNSFVYAIATDTGTTTIEVIPSASTQNMVAGQTYTYNLTQGQVFNALGLLTGGNDGVDLTGTKIRSVSLGVGGCKRIAVFSGSGKINIKCPLGSSGVSADNYMIQAFPKNAWGKNYLTVPTSQMPSNYFRIAVLDPSTTVKLNGATLNGLINNFYYQIDQNNTPNFIEADKPIMVAQYITTANQCGNTALGGNGDPEVIYLSPIEQNIDKVIINSTPNFSITRHYINVVIPNGGTALSSFRIDGTIPAFPFVVHPQNASYSYLVQSLSAGQHTVQSDSGFNAIAYGYGSAESYGYNAGANVKDLYQFVSIQNQYATVNFPSTCKNTPFRFSMTFPYQPSQIKWVFGTALNGQGISDVTINSPIPDSTWIINGKQLYRYPLTTPYNIVTIGTYPIKVIAQNPSPDGCSGEQEIDYDLQVFERPISDFNFTASGCISDSVKFMDNTNTSGRPIIKWYWDFADPGSGTAAISTQQNPLHLFSVAGSHTISFASITDIGCLSDTTRKGIIISAPPLAKFGLPAPFCISKNLTFVDSSTTPSGTIIKWTWNFGDGTPAVIATTNVAQTHSYSIAGNYTITLQVENAGGCKSLTFSKTIAISAIPIPNFTFGNACLPNGVMQFTNSSTIADGTGNSFSYSWTFGDGGISAVKDPAHNYASVGPFDVSLLVTSNAGCADNVKKTVTTIYAEPQAKFIAPAETCLGTVVNFTDQSAAASSTISAWQWNFGDGQTSTLQNPAHTYSTAGSYVVTLIVSSAVGCSSNNQTQNITINPLPKADFISSMPQCAGRPLTFTDASQANVGNIVKWTWDFGDGSVPVQAGTNVSQTHSYLNTGIYTVTLRVETNKGCIGIITSKQITISPLPVVGFKMPDNCLNDPISTFIDTSSIADGSEAQFAYLWNFGDPNSTGANPNTSTIKNGRHKYTAAQNYNVALTVTSDKGCSTSLTQVFNINGAVPVSLFTTQGGAQHCSNDSIIITDNSTVDVGKLVKLEIYWDYANNPTNKATVSYPVAGANYIHSYAEFFTPATKTSTIRVIAYSGDNCLQTLDQTLTLKATPNIVFPSIAPICADKNSFQILTSVANMTGGSGTFSGRGVSSNGVFDPGVAGFGTHTLTYTYTAANGCSNSKQQTVTVFPVPMVSAGPDKFVLSGGTAVLNGTTTGSRPNFLWTPATYLNNPMIAQPLVTPADDIRYTLTVTTADGCSDSDGVFVKVLKEPAIPNVFTPNGDGINDKWVIQYLESYPGAIVEIFNRYGSLVFRSVGYTKPWDGTFNGKEMPAGTYYYIINPKNGRKQISGFVDIVR